MVMQNFALNCVGYWRNGSFSKANDNSVVVSDNDVLNYAYDLPDGTSEDDFIAWACLAFRDNFTILKGFENV